MWKRICKNDVRFEKTIVTLLSSQKRAVTVIGENKCRKQDLLLEKSYIKICL